MEDSAAGTRLDIFMTQYFWNQAEPYGFSRSRIQRLIAEGHITVNGARARSSTRLRCRDLVELSEVPAGETSLMAEALPLDIIYEDSDCIVINKAPGMVVHPAAGNVTGTLVNALLYHCPTLRGIGTEDRPGVVHRLDKFTSGVMVVAKNQGSLQHLAHQFKNRSVEKEYLALVWGGFDQQSGTINRPIGRHPAQRKKMSSLYTSARARAAMTEWRVLKSFNLKGKAGSGRAISFLRVKLHTGRTHQIRVHLSDLGHPVVGDKVYGRAGLNNSIDMQCASCADIFSRQALHAQSLAFDNPKSGLRLKFEAPLADDMERLLRTLEEQERKSSVRPDRC